MKLFQMFKRNASPQTVDELMTLLNVNHQTNSGMNVNTDTAQCLPAVYCAVNTIAEAVAAMPLHVYKRADNGDKQRQRTSTIERLFNITPNGYQTAFDFKVAMMRSALLTGNAYAEIIYDNAARINKLIPLHPNEVIIKKLPEHRIGYQVTSNGKVRNLQQEEVLHIKINSDDGITGKSPITVCRESIGAELAAQTHGASVFKNGARPTGTLNIDKVLTTDQRQAIRTNLVDKFSGALNAGKPLLLEAGTEYKPIAMSNQDAEWLESRKFGIAEIARMFKISPIFIMDYSNSTYSNFAEASKAFLQQTLKPWLTNIELAVLTTLVAERNQSILTIEFETKDILRTTAKERFEIYDIAIRNGLMSPNECRKAENLEARERGDDFSQSWLQQTQAEEPAQD